MKITVVVTSRVGSSRVPGKAFKRINGVPLIEHLLKRCLGTGLPVCLAIPAEDAEAFAAIDRKFEQMTTYCGEDEDPMARLLRVAEATGSDAIVRVCHDKVFIEPELVRYAVRTFEEKNLDYLFSSQFTPGSGFEIISRDALERACAKYREVEHVSYAVKSLTMNQYDLPIPEAYRIDARFLVDYPEDLTMLEVVMSQIGNDGTLLDAIACVKQNGWMRKINSLPEVTLYTCAFNAERFIEKCMGSVAAQHGFRRMEYVLIDDHSSDGTTLLMAEMAAKFPNVRLIRNPFNLGLASSSNVALAEARGQYIMRLDADDYFVDPTAVQRMLEEIRETHKDAIYPNNYFGSMRKVQNGKLHHHVGGSIFRRSAVNHVKFTEMLRGFEGLDFFERAKDQINIGYLGKPMFFYRQHKGSMSKTNLEERARIKAEIEARA